MAALSSSRGGATAAAAWLTGAACGAAGLALLSRLAARRGLPRGKARVIAGTDFRGTTSSYVRSEGEGVVGLLAYDVCEPLSEEEYDRWLFDVHYHDLMANPHLEKIVLHTVSKDKEARLSSGAKVENKVNFFRMAELHFRDYAAFDGYVAWFRANVIPADRSPAGKSAFKFYHLAGKESILRGGRDLPGDAAALRAPAAASATSAASAAAGTAQPPAGPPPTQAAPATVLVIGASGTIGAEVVRQLRARPGVEVLEASSRLEPGPGKVSVDIRDAESVRGLDAALPGGVDHVVVCCGPSTFGPLEKFDARTWEDNVNSKLIALSRLVVMLANGEEVKCLRPGGSITVTAGQSARKTFGMWPGLALNNAGLEAFVKCSGIKAPRGVRINAVSPALISETAAKANLSQEGTVPVSEVAAAYLPCVFGTASGQVVDAGSQLTFGRSHTGTS